LDKADDRFGFCFGRGRWLESDEALSLRARLACLKMFRQAFYGRKDRSRLLWRHVRRIFVLKRDLYRFHSSHLPISFWRFDFSKFP
jgi:hypothetical protein